MVVAAVVRIFEKCTNVDGHLSRSSFVPDPIFLNKVESLEGFTGDVLVGITNGWSNTQLIGATDSPWSSTT